MLDLQELFNLKPGQKALIQVEVLSSRNKGGVKAAITCVGEGKQVSREEYFKVTDIQVSQATT